MAQSTTAIVIDRHGTPEVLRQRRVPVPPLGAGEIHIRVLAAGLNFADLVMRAGMYDTAPARPYSPGFEVAGEIVNVAPGVDRWRSGDRVVALLRYGGYAHDVVVPAGQVFPYPASMTPVAAAAVPVAFLTAWVCLFECARARAGETVLVLGAGGGVGTAAVQLGVRAGLRVVGTAGTERKREFVTAELGAAACFDSRGDWEREVRKAVGARGIDLALDSVGGPATRACRRLLAPLGRLGFYGLSDAIPGSRRNLLAVVRSLVRMPLIHPLSLVQPSIGVFGVHLLHLHEKEHILRTALEEVFAAVATEELRPVIDRVFPLDRDGAVAAHRHVHARGNLGKVILARDVP